MRLVIAAVASSLAVVSASAHAGAQEGDAVVVNRSLSASFVERPLQLAPGAWQPTFMFDVTNVSVSSDSASGEVLSAALDAGVTKNLQLGLYVTVPVNPSGFGSAIGSLQGGLSEQASLRVDAGILRGILDAGALGSSSANAFALGVGAPLKLRLSHEVAFISGRPGTAQFGRPFAISEKGMGGATGANPAFSGDDLFYFIVNDGGTASYVVNLPVGLLLSPNDHFAIGLRSGFRAVFPADGDTSKAIPLGIDLMVSLSPEVGLGASFDLAGIIDEQRVSYTDVRQFGVWLQARL